MQDFNPRSRMGSDRQRCHQFLAVRDFNPRSRMGSDFMLSAFNLVDGMISIHAPAWGATILDLISDFHSFLISIHAPAWGATGL